MRPRFNFLPPLALSSRRKLAAIRPVTISPPTIAVCRLRHLASSSPRASSRLHSVGVA
ncbi:hypothetical protein PgNI_11428, partial [Pyricularia grisea]|uniref:Uncharacterized protein n=1 Tax=Pyricularia grisea TaxID=148305 RepID=A0A6P8APM5_PYRGI